MPVPFLNSENLGRLALHGSYGLTGGGAGAFGSIILTQGTALVLPSGGITALSVVISNLALYLLKSRGVELNFGIKCLSDVGVTIVVLVAACALGIACPAPLIIASAVGAIVTRLLLDGPEACRDPWERRFFDY